MLPKTPQPVMHQTEQTSGLVAAIRPDSASRMVLDSSHTTRMDKLAAL